MRSHFFNSVLPVLDVYILFEKKFTQRLSKLRNRLPTFCILLCSTRIGCRSWKSHSIKNIFLKINFCSNSKRHVALIINVGEIVVVCVNEFIWQVSRPPVITSCVEMVSFKMKCSDASWDVCLFRRVRHWFYTRWRSMSHVVTKYPVL